MRYCLFFLLCCCATQLFSQAATYKLSNKTNGSYSDICVRKSGDQVDVNIRAKWNNTAGTYGEFTGKGVLEDNKCVLKGEKDSPTCTISLDFSDSKLEVIFQNCETYQLMEDFSGSYTRIADNIPGEYVVVSDISYLYSKPNDKSRKKDFRSKTELLNVEELFEGNWGFATFMVDGKQSFGYIKLTDLKLKRTYLYD